MLVGETADQIARTSMCQRRRSRIARELPAWRNMVGKVLGAGSTEFRYKRYVQPRPPRRAFSLLGAERDANAS